MFLEINGILFLNKNVNYKEIIIVFNCVEVYFLDINYKFD